MTRTSTTMPERGKKTTNSTVKERSTSSPSCSPNRDDNSSLSERIWFLPARFHDAALLNMARVAYVLVILALLTWWIRFSNITSDEQHDWRRSFTKINSDPTQLPSEFIITFLAVLPGIWLFCFPNVLSAAVLSVIAFCVVLKTSELHLCVLPWFSGFSWMHVVVGGFFVGYATLQLLQQGAEKLPSGPFNFFVGLVHNPLLPAVLIFGTITIHRLYYVGSAPAHISEQYGTTDHRTAMTIVFFLTTMLVNFRFDNRKEHETTVDERLLDEQWENSIGSIVFLHLYQQRKDTQRRTLLAAGRVMRAICVSLIFNFHTSWDGSQSLAHVLMTVVLGQIVNSVGYILEAGRYMEVGEEENATKIMKQALVKKMMRQLLISGVGLLGYGVFCKAADFHCRRVGLFNWLSIVFESTPFLVAADAIPLTSAEFCLPKRRRQHQEYYDEFRAKHGESNQHPDEKYKDRPHWKTRSQQGWSNVFTVIFMFTLVWMGLVASYPAFMFQNAVAWEVPAEFNNNDYWAVNVADCQKEDGVEWWKLDGGRRSKCCLTRGMDEPANKPPSLDPLSLLRIDPCHKDPDNKYNLSYVKCGGKTRCVWDLCKNKRRRRC